MSLARNRSRRSVRFSAAFSSSGGATAVSRASLTSKIPSAKPAVEHSEAHADTATAKAIRFVRFFTGILAPGSNKIRTVLLGKPVLYASQQALERCLACDRYSLSLLQRLIPGASQRTAVTAEFGYLHCGRLHQVIPCHGKAGAVEQYFGNRAAVAGDHVDPAPHGLVDYQRLGFIGIVGGKQKNVQAPVKALLVEPVHGSDILDIACGAQQLVEGRTRLRGQRARNMRPVLDAKLLQPAQYAEKFDEALVESDIGQETDLYRRSIHGPCRHLILARIVE